MATSPRVIQNSVYLEAHPKNFNQNTRRSSDIKYIVVHYTGNVNDTARNNAMYFRQNAVQSSAHYFVSENQIYQCVPDYHAAYAVGIGKMNKPYDSGVIGWKKITNSNSISVEICGSKTTNEGSLAVKMLAAKLVADLLDCYGLTPDDVYRHYDVTGKWCPWWAVEHPEKWDSFKDMVRKEYMRGGDDELQNTPENYQVFKEFMKKYEDELSKTPPADWEQTALTFCDSNGIISDGRAKSKVTRGELATVVQRIINAFGLHK